VGGIPVTYLIDRDGKIASRHVGYGEGMEKQLEEEATHLLAAGVTSQ
jgi:alanine racemase